MILNCTPHDINIIDESCVVFNRKVDSYVLDGEIKILRTFKPSGYTPKLKVNEDDVCMLEDIQVVQKIYGDVRDLPDREDDCWLIVSSMVAKAGKEQGRTDLLTPARLVRDERGRIVGCLALGTE